MTGQPVFTLELYGHAGAHHGESIIAWRRLASMVHPQRTVSPSGLKPHVCAGPTRTEPKGLAGNVA